MVIKVLKKVDMGKYYEEEYYDVLVDDEDYSWVRKLNLVIVKGAGGGHYAKTRIFDKYYFLHHLVNGVPLPGYVTDHIDRNGLNDYRNNLRVVTHRQNGSNKEREKSCKYLGVCLDKSKKTYKYKASIMIQGKNIHLGRYTTAEEASKVYQNKLKEIGENSGSVAL